MFAHGMSEIYAEFEPTLKKLGVLEFNDLLQKTNDLAQSKAPADDVEIAANAVLAALDGAAKKAPGPVTAEVETAVFAEMLDRAALQYARALRDKTGDAYLDGYGFYAAALRRSEAVLAHLKAANPQATAAASEALKALSAAYPGIAKPASGAPEAAPALVATSKFRLALSGK
jgi:hypothetical protein